MAKAMENPLSKPDIQQKYKEYLDYEADELTTRTGANGPLELCYGSWQEMVESFNKMGISITFDIDIAEI